MERQAIERLAMDIALGELNEDATVLFNAYLAEHPQARQWTEQMTAICAQTQEAIARKTQQMNPAAWRPRACAGRSAPVQWVRLGRWAAIVMVSLALGAAAGRWVKPNRLASGPPVVVESIRNVEQPRWPPILSTSGMGFWESKAAAIVQPKPYRLTGRRSSQPSLWEAFRQFQKERSHE